MKYLIMCGGTYEDWEYPKHMAVVNGEPKDIAYFDRILKTSD